MKTTTIQVREDTLALLRKLKHELNVNSYDEVIAKKVAPPRMKSFAGSLAKYYKNIPLKKILDELQDERRKSDRF